MASIGGKLVKDVAMARAKALPPVPAKQKAARTISGTGTNAGPGTLLNAINESSQAQHREPMSQSSKNIQTRVGTEQALKKEVGGRR